MTRRRFSGWLQVPRILDPVDRRNAATVQLVLLGLGVLPPLLWAYRVLGSDLPWREGETVSMISGLAVSAMALGCLFLLRRGRFQWAIRLLLAVVAATLLLAYAGSGIVNQTHVMPLQVMWLFVAGMMVGRRALWAMLAVLVAAFFLGAAAEMKLTGEPAVRQIGDVVVRTAMFLLIAIIVDRSVAALRESLREATERGVELEKANTRLRSEMAAREQTQARLLHAQKMDAIGKMAGGLAHDFGHLLTLVNGYAGQARRASSPADLEAALDGVLSTTTRAHAQVRKLLHFARRDTSQAECFDAIEALREIAPMLRQALGSRVQFDLHLPPSPARIRLDREHLLLVLLNVAANASDAMPEGGRFSLHAGVSGDGTALEIRMRDDGGGIPDSVRPRIFEPFFTTKPEGLGAGLGLATSRDLIVQSGGTLDLEPAEEERKGAAFRIRLPLVAAPDLQDAALPFSGAYQSSM
jgi:signal transduction histidine kinase